MPNCSHCDPIVNLEKFLARLTERDKQNAFAVTERRDGTTGGELPFDVLAPVSDRFDPTIRLFNHNHSWNIGTVACAPAPPLSATSHSAECTSAGRTDWKSMFLMQPFL